MRWSSGVCPEDNDSELIRRRRDKWRRTSAVVFDCTEALRYEPPKRRADLRAEGGASGQRPAGTEPGLASAGIAGQAALVLRSSRRGLPEEAVPGLPARSGAESGARSNSSIQKVAEVVIPLWRGGTS